MSFPFFSSWIVWFSFFLIAQVSEFLCILDIRPLPDMCFINTFPSLYLFISVTGTFVHQKALILIKFNLKTFNFMYCYALMSCVRILSLDLNAKVFLLCFFMLYSFTLSICLSSILNLLIHKIWSIYFLGHYCLCSILCVYFIYLFLIA